MDATCPPPPDMCLPRQKCLRTCHQPRVLQALDHLFDPGLAQLDKRRRIDRMHALQQYQNLIVPGYTSFLARSDHKPPPPPPTFDQGGKVTFSLLGLFDGNLGAVDPFPKRQFK